MGPPPREDSRLEQLARKADLEPEELREWLRWEIGCRQEEAEQAWRAELLAALAEPLVESSGRKNGPAA